ncbi:MAG: SusC/RagA family TonB-linked outer membrane protein [Bacteroidota bacterium]|nr:SusC/RagA family TonB-linked outer membrane protein [Bacteroidota bacterium]
MRKSAHYFISAFFALLCITGLAQERTLSGTVRSGTDNTALPGVTVRVKGTNRVVQTNASGVFTIRASKGEVLQLTHVGFDEQNITVGDNNNIAVSMKKNEAQLGEVVVTAMDIKRNARELGYSVQTVKGTDIQQTQRENFVNSLQGRVSGLTVTPTSGAAGASAGIVLRGFNTLSGNNQPLFIVDGVIIDNQTLNSNSQSGSGIGLASDGNNRNNDNTNRIADINPNDIESVTVLKGPEATALYGSQAGSGAIVITTKKSKSTNGKLLLSYDNNFRFQRITRFAQTDNDYSPGSSNVPAPITQTSTGTFTSFGPKWKPGTQLYDNLHHFYETGFSQTHNVSADIGGKVTGFRITGQYFDDHGVVPNNTYRRYNAKITNTTKIGKYITITPAIAYTNANTLRPLKSSATSAGAGGYLLDLYAWPANNDIRNYQGPTGRKLILYNQTNRNADYDNPLWGAYNNSAGDKLDRVISTLGIDINPTSWLSIAGRFGYDYYKNNGYVFNHPESFMLTSAIGGSLDNYYRTYKGYNHTITATVKKKFGDFSTRLLVGTMWQDLETQQFAVYGTNLIDSTSKDSSNTAVNTRKRLLRNYYGQPNVNIFRELAYFAEASIGYKNMVFLTYSHRFESASPLPKANRNYNYPGASLSLILTDIFPQLGKLGFLDYAKLRGSLASTARLNDPYSNQSFFVNNFSSTVLPVTYTYGFTNANPQLMPEKQKTYETGLELRFLNNAITLEAAYYNTLCTNQIAQGYRASYATGYILNTQNAASLRNQGVEIALNITPVKRPDFVWNIGFNFNHMWSKVLTLPASIDQFKDFYNSDTYISNVRGGLVRGYSTGTITGSTYQRTSKGLIIVDPSTGIPLTNAGTNTVIGDRTPKFTLGTLNTLRYKNWNLSFLWDLKVGGDIYNGTDQLLTNLGKSKRTSNRATPIVVQGVLNDQYKNTANPTVNTLVVIPQYNSTYYTTLPDEEFIQKNVNWLRLRDVTLSYMVPASAMKRLRGFSGLSAFITANDLVLFTNYYGADPAVNANNPGTNGVGGYGMDLGSPPTPISISFGLRANF